MLNLSLISDIGKENTKLDWALKKSREDGIHKAVTSEQNSAYALGILPQFFLQCNKVKHV